MGRVLANMVARNESPHYLDRVLKRLVNQVDMIIFTDDASDDDTAEIADGYGAKVQKLDEPLFTVHEGQLRQKSWDFLEKYVMEGDWVLSIDADEELYFTRYDFDALMANRNYDVYNVEFYHMWNEHQYRIDKAWRPHGSTRFFRYKPGGKYKDRQLACGAEPTYVVDDYNQGRYYANSGLKMKHLSYIKDVDKKRKFDRYSALDGGTFHAGAHILSIMDGPDVYRLADWEWE